MSGAGNTIAKTVLEDAAKVQDRAKKDYGDSTDGHRHLGEIWAALINQRFPEAHIPPLPVDLVLTMLAGSKLNRAAKEGIRPDDYIDAASYAALAYEASMVEQGRQELLEEVRKNAR